MILIKCDCHLTRSIGYQKTYKINFYGSKLTTPNFKLEAWWETSEMLMSIFKYMNVFVNCILIFSLLFVALYAKNFGCIDQFHFSGFEISGLSHACRHGHN